MKIPQTLPRRNFPLKTMSKIGSQTSQSTSTQRTTKTMEFARVKTFQIESLSYPLKIAALTFQLVI
jgi:hypothetical protein